MQKTGYRAEIDGLRAIAVLSVVVFHAGVERLSGGYAGVDVFYVISGYLITGIVVSAVSEQRFSVVGFYERRMKRLLPPALVMTLVVLAAGWFMLTPFKYDELAKSAAYSSVFIANVWFMRNSGYFDLSSEVSPLVHMWSLSVEEQFYLVFPVLLLVAYRIRGIRGIKAAIAIAIAISIALSVTLSAGYPNFSFYMLPTRAWELGLGALLNFLPARVFGMRKLTSELVSVIGLALLFFGFFWLGHHDIYPGHLALIPTLGTFLLLGSLANHDGWVKQLLTSSPLVFVGKSSYSCYLWHWPLIVYYRIYVNERDFHPHEILLLIVASILLGYLSWRFVENRFRYIRRPTSGVYAASLFATAVVVSAACLIHLNNGFQHRVSEAALAITDWDRMWKWNCTEEIEIFPASKKLYCVVGRPWHESQRKGLVWGDSHSLHFAQLLHGEALKIGASLVIAPEGCPAYLDVVHLQSNYPKRPTFTEDCTERNRRTRRWLRESPEVEAVIFAAAWSGHMRMHYSDSQRANRSYDQLSEGDAKVGGQLAASAFAELLLSLKDRKVLILGDVPRPNRVLNQCAFSDASSLLRERCEDQSYRRLDAAVVSEWHADSDAVLSSMAKRFDNVRVLFPSRFLCDRKSCLTYLNGELIYKDNNHIRRNLTPESAEQLAAMLGLGVHLESLWD